MVREAGRRRPRGNRLAGQQPVVQQLRRLQEAGVKLSRQHHSRHQECAIALPHHCPLLQPLRVLGLAWQARKRTDTAAARGRRQLPLQALQFQARKETQQNRRRQHRCCPSLLPLARQL